MLWATLFSCIHKGVTQIACVSQWAIKRVRVVRQADFVKGFLNGFPLNKMQWIDLILIEAIPDIGPWEFGFRPMITLANHLLPNVVFPAFPSDWRIVACEFIQNHNVKLSCLHRPIRLAQLSYVLINSIDRRRDIFWEWLIIFVMSVLSSRHTTHSLSLFIPFGQSLTKVKCLFSFLKMHWSQCFLWCARHFWSCPCCLQKSVVRLQQVLAG